MIFSDELLKTLEADGMQWTREDDGTLTYVSCYEHSMATVFPEKETFTITNEARDPSEKGIICERTFADCKSPEDLLKDVAGAAEAIDYGIEQAMTSICPYDTVED